MSGIKNQRPDIGATVYFRARDLHPPMRYEVQRGIIARKVTGYYLEDGITVRFAGTGCFVLKKGEYTTKREDLE